MPKQRQLGSICRHFQAEYGARLLPPPTTPEAVRGLFDRQLLVFLSAVESRPCMPMDRATRQALTDYVRNGGRILLLGFTTNLVHELGLEPRAPDRFGTYRWGISAATALGQYRFGFRKEPKTVRGLTRRLRPTSQRADSWFVGGGELVATQSCHWEQNDPERGIVLGRLFRDRDGESRALRSAVLTFWPVGRGGILALGNLPEPWRADPTIAGNARRFLDNAVVSLCKGQPSAVAVLVRGPATQPATGLEPLPRLAVRPMPGATLLPHWGWHVALPGQGSKAVPVPMPVSVEHIEKQILRPSYLAGADLLDLRLADRQRGYPMAWQDADPIVRPASFRGGLFWHDWNADTLRRLALSAHRHGLLLQAYLLPEFAPGGTAAENLAATRWFARELLDVRRLGAAALDGIGFHRGWDDPAGASIGVLRQYHPAGYAYHTGRVRHRVAAAVGVVHANLGALPGLHASGVSKAWRDVFPAREFPLGVLDCRTRPAGEPTWPGMSAAGGGGYGDWILTQVNDFVRQRIGIGAGLWWQAFDRQLMTAAAIEYVHGISMLPIKAAVAGRLSATGTGGYRDLVRQFLPAVQSGFGAEHPLPARTPFLQNNYLRVYGTGGPLQFDPSGRALFDAGQDLTGRAPLMTSRWSQVRLAKASAAVHPVDFIVGATRGPQGYGPTVSIPADGRGGGTFPAQLSFDRPGAWPRRAELTFHAHRANYVLQLELEGVEGRGIVEVRREGELLRLLSFVAGQQRRRIEIPFPIARAGERALSLEVVDGGTLAISACRLEPRGSGLLDQALPTEVAVRERAGALAELEETTGTRILNERRRLTTIADWPGFVLSIHYGFLKPGMRVDREFDFGGYRTVRSIGGAQGPRIRGAIVLSDADRRLPELMVVPLELPRGHFLQVTESGRVRLVGFPQTNFEVRIGFVWLRDGDLDLATARAICRDVIKPVEVRLGALDGDAVPAGSAATAGTRLRPSVEIAYPRVVRVIADTPQLFRVTEGEFCFERGGQPASDRGVFVHIYHVGGAPVTIDAADSFDPRYVRPGPGCRHSLVLEQPTAQSAIVHLRELGPLVRAPAVRVPAPFNTVHLDGRPWPFFAGDLVFLPRRLGTYELVTKTVVEVGQHLCRSSAPVKSCEFDHVRGILSIEFDRSAATEQVAQGEQTVWVSGAPIEIEGGRRIEEHEFGYDATDQRAALHNGASIRVAGPVLRVRYPRGAVATEGVAAGPGDEGGV